MSDNATPRPWKVQQLHHAQGMLWLQIGQASGFGPITSLNCTAAPLEQGVVSEMKHLVTDEETQKANAALIVTAVNAHEELLSAAKDIVDFLDELIVRPDEHAVIKQLRAAIANAEGRE